MVSIARATNLTERWLRGEHDYQFGKSDPIFGDDTAGRLHFLLQEELPNRWYQFQVLARAGVEAHASQWLMKVCAATRAGVVLSGLLLRREFIAVNQASWQYLAELPLMHEDSVQTWATRLSQPFESAVGFGIREYTSDNHAAVVRPAFHNTVRLAVARLCSADEVVLPEPGHPSGEIAPWNEDI